MFCGPVGIFVRRLTDFGMNNLTILFTRTAVASAILFLVLLIMDRDLLKLRLKDFWIFAGSGIVAVLGLNYCYTESVNNVSLSLAAVLLSLSPVFVMLIAAVLFKEKITRVKVISTIAAIAGCFLVSGLIEKSAMNWSAYGIMIGALSAFFYALYSIISKIAMERGYNAFTITFYSLFFVALVLIPFTDFGTVTAFAAEAPVKNGLFMLLHALCANVFPYGTYTLALRYVDAGKVSILAAGAEPSAAMIFGILFFGEIPSVLMVAGLVITIAALYYLCRTAEETR